METTNEYQEPTKLSKGHRETLTSALLSLDEDFRKEGEEGYTEEELKNMSDGDLLDEFYEQFYPNS